MAFLTLEDGEVFEAQSFGAAADVMGEVVFNTSMVGYQEILTDPSYSGQIVTMTYPLIGNYGINATDVESSHPQPNGFIVREYCEQPSNWRCERTLADYLQKNNMVALCGLDTRALTRRIREKGTMRGIITQAPATPEQIAQMKVYQKVRPVDEVTCDNQYMMEGGQYRVAVLDFGLKRNIIRSLHVRDCELTVLPAHTEPERILNGGFDGLMLTNGPGDPKENVEIIANLQKMLGKIPTFGICLGHQLMALALGGDTEKLKFGHRGANHPVKNLLTNHTFITSQNHGYTVRADSLPSDATITHISMNDGTVEGIRYADIPAFSVQFHPEAVPGPRDSAVIFDGFINMMKKEAL